MKLINAFVVIVLLVGTNVFAQNTNPQNQKAPLVSEAYTVLVREKAKYSGDLYEARQRFTAESTQFKTTLLKFTLLSDEIKKLASVTAGNAARFTSGYGSLILTKVQTEVELFELRQTNTFESIAFRRKRIELESLNNDLKQINESFR